MIGMREIDASHQTAVTLVPNDSLDDIIYFMVKIVERNLSLE